MSMTEQDRVVEAIRSRFDQSADAVHDLRDGSHSGYRAVHLWARLDSPRGAWFEVQVRTRLQGQWANMYEALADVLGRGIRYGELPVGEGDRALVEQTQLLALNVIAAIETVREVVSSLEREEPIDRDLLAEAFVNLGFPPDVAVTQAARAALPAGMDLAAITRGTVEDISAILTEMEEHVRSLSQGKGE